MPRSSLGFGAVLLLFSLLCLPRAAAAIECSPSFTCTTAPSDEETARRCLCVATRFFDEARSVLDAGFSSFDEILPSDYEFPGKYEEARLDAVIAFASAAPRTTSKDEILFEAAFRKASAHGMFADDGLLRGLDPRSGGGGVGPEQVITVARERIDSRVCHDAASIPIGTPCLVGADCAAGNACRAKRFGSDGPFGAIQEYRRAEQALVDVIRVLGVQRFRELDEAMPRCLGVGCATRLLLRLGAMKARAQAERADLLWRRAAAASGVPSDAPRCSEGAIGRVCAVHADCDEGEGGRCGSGRPDEGSAILLRQAIHEALAEASVGQALYAALFPTGTLEESVDFAQRRNALARLAEIERRSIDRVTPFGVPADYVPLLSSVQQAHLDCLQSCGTACDQASNARCLVSLAEGAGFLNLLQQARLAQQQAVASAEDFANAAQDRLAHENQIRDEFVRVIERLLGASCADQGISCDCSSSDFERGRCVTFDNETWVIQGAVCTDPNDPARVCSIEGVDGEIERQILAIRNGELAFSNLVDRLDRNAEAYEQTIRKFAELAGIQEQACEDTEAAIQQAAEDTSNAIEQKHSAQNTSGFLGVLGDVIAGAVSGGIQSQKISAAEGLGSGLFVGGALALAGGLQATNQINQQLAQQAFEKEIHRIQSEKELALERIKCRTNGAILEVEKDDALFQIETERQLLLAALSEQKGVILEALTGAQQLTSELLAARERFDEAQELRRIFDDLDFRNPANYRAVALAKQLEAVDQFRTAQVLTWMILRSVAYDLARPDFPLPEGFPGASVLQIEQCQQTRCSLSGTPCATDTQCTGGAGDTCQLAAADEAGVADAEGACSMQAVFAARTVDDLEALIGSALLQLAASNRTLACEGECQKRISLRNLFTDANLPAAEQPSLGEVLLGRSPVAGLLATFEFEISPQRGFRICPQLPDGSIFCQPEGVANLSGSDVDGFGNLSANVWNARMIGVKGLVRYDPTISPALRLCRDPADGEVVNTSFTACRTTGGAPLPEGSDCPHAAPPAGETGCATGAGTPTSCKCITVLASANARPVVSLRQLDAGVVRTSLAEMFLDESIVPRPADSFLRFRMRRGDLPLLGTVPRLEPFRVPSLTLFEDENLAVEQISIKGVPVASSRWELRLASQGLLRSDRYRRAFLGSIVDIELILTYQGFDL